MARLTFDFIGKDSIPYQNTIDIPDDVADALRDITEGKSDEEQLFSIDASDINDFLGECIPEATAKLFRTAIGTKTMIDAFKKQKVTKDMSLDVKLAAFNEANLEVAKVLNHKKAVSKTFQQQMDNADEKIKKQKALIRKLRQELKALEDRDKIAAKQDKEDYDAEACKVRSEQRKQKTDRKAEQLEKARSKLESLKNVRDFKEMTADSALNTSKTNYISPEVIVSIAKDMNIPIEKVYSKALIDKFAWAMDTPADFWKKFGKK